MKYAFYGFMVLLIGVASVWFLGKGSVEDDVAVDSSVIRLSAEISGRAYNPPSFDVPLGSTVELTVTNRDNEQHGLSIPDLGVRGFIGARQVKTIIFEANQLGRASTFCSQTHPEKLIINVI